MGCIVHAVMNLFLFYSNQQSASVLNRRLHGVSWVYMGVRGRSVYFPNDVNDCLVNYDVGASVRLDNAEKTWPTD